ncbi:MAG: hypothetical protein RL766_751 [Bacteroidota bacterium]|jgi:hypothetical protein
MLQETSALVLDLQYFPSINWFKDSVQISQFVFYPEAVIRKAGFSNRMLLPASGGVVLLSVPLVGGRSVRIPYREVRIDYKSEWQRDHIRTIDTVYGGAPFYFHYKDELHHLFCQREEYLYNWNLSCLKWVLEKLKIKIPIQEDTGQSINLNKSIIDLDKYKPSNFSSPENGPFLKYPQVFEDKIGFQINMSVLDLLFNVGPLKVKELLSV